jgi:hypothetical protein
MRYHSLKYIDCDIHGHYIKGYVSKCFSNVSISSSPNKHQNQVKLVKEKLSPYIESQIYCYFFKVSYGKWKLTQNLFQFKGTSLTKINEYSFIQLN